MHRWSTEEAHSLKELLSFSNHPYREVYCSPPGVTASLIGWTTVRPNAVYDIVNHLPMKKRRHRPSNHGLPFHFAKKTDNHAHTGMSGELNQDFSYVYTGGLSSKASRNEAGPMYNSPSPNPTYPTQTVTLGAALPYRQMDMKAHMDISRLLATQIKPELLVEQIIIENRLRALSLTAFPSLNLEGHGMSQNSSTVPTKSRSVPLLLPQAQQQQQQQSPHRKKKKRKRHKPGQGALVWCPLTASDKETDGGEILRDACLLPASLPFDGASKENMQLSGLSIDPSSIACTARPRAGDTGAIQASNTKKQDVKGKWTGDKIVYDETKMQNGTKVRPNGKFGMDFSILPAVSPGKSGRTASVSKHL